MVNLKVLFNPLFFLIGISNAVGMIGFYTPFVYLPSMAAQFVRDYKYYDFKEGFFLLKPNAS